MKSALWVTGALALGLMVLAACLGKLDVSLRNTARTAWMSLPVLALAILVMGFTEALLPRGWVEKWMGESTGMAGLLVALAAGVLTPGGSMVGFPLAAGLLRSGASPAVVVTYLTASATLSLIRLPMEIGLLGLRFTLVKAGATVALPLLAGVLTRALTQANPIK